MKPQPKTVKVKTVRGAQSDAVRADKLGDEYTRLHEEAETSKNKLDNCKAEIKSFAAASGEKEDKSVLVEGKKWAVGFLQTADSITFNPTAAEKVLAARYGSLLPKLFKKVLDEDAIERAVIEGKITEKHFHEMFDTKPGSRRIEVKRLTP